MGCVEAIEHKGQTRDGKVICDLFLPLKYAREEVATLKLLRGVENVVTLLDEALVGPEGKARKLMHSQPNRRSKIDFSVGIHAL